MDFTILHLSDLHLAHLNFRPSRWMGKSFLGMSNLLLSRHFHFRREILKAVVERMLRHPAEIAAVTGDLTTTGQPEEFELAREALEPLRAHVSRIMIIPGNHDRYTRRVVRGGRYETLFGNKSFPWAVDAGSEKSLLRLVAIETSRPRPISSAGQYFDRQTEPLVNLLSETNSADGITGVLAHYPVICPPIYRVSLTHGMRNRKGLLDALEVSPPDFYLHGHTHRTWAFFPEKPEILRNMLVISGGCASRSSGKRSRAAGFNEIKFLGHNVTVTRHFFDGRRWRNDIIFTGPIGKARTR